MSGEMISSKEVAGLLGVSARYVTEKLRHRQGFPVPTQLYPRGEFKWKRDEVEKFRESRLVSIWRK